MAKKINKATVVAMGFQPDKARTGFCDLANGFWKCRYDSDVIKGFYMIEVEDGLAIEWH